MRRLLRYFSFLVFGAPLLTFLLPVYGRDWGTNAWKVVFVLTFIPLWILFFSRLRVRMNSDTLTFVMHLWAYWMTWSITTKIIRPYRDIPLVVFLDIFIVIFVAAMLVFIAPKLRDRYDAWKASQPAKEPLA